MLLAALLTFVGSGAARPSADPQAIPYSPSTTQIVLLGTGNPPADPDRSGPATAIVVNGTPYLIDMGAELSGERNPPSSTRASPDSIQSSFGSFL
jgi:hypothetical protein